MVANKRNTIKRKASDKETEETNAPQQELEETGGDHSEASDYESDKENLLGNIDNDADSSDSEGDEEYVSDDEEALSFESADSDFDEAEIKDVEKAATADGDESEEDDDDSAADVNSDSSPEEDNGDESSEFEEDVPEEEEKKETKLDSVKKADAKLDDADDDADDDDDDDDDIPKLKKIESVLKKHAVKKVRGVGIFPPMPEVKKGKPLDEYADGDTSDEEDIRNTVGNIPMHWYTDYKHIGYDWDAKKIVKAKQGDAIDEFLKRMEDPDFGRTVKDPQTGQNVVLSEEDVALIKRIMAGQNPDAEYDDYGKWIEWFSSEVEQMPIRNIPDSKQSFLPSKAERQRIGKYVHALKMGWMKTKAEKRRLAANSKGPKFYMLWETDHGQEEMRRIHDHVVAPKRPLPHHAESYNPPPEYLFNAQEMEQWKRYEDEPWKRKLHFIPQKFNSLREVPAYSNYIKERFIRCLDLYLCPRGKRTRVTVGPEYLVPKLPSPRELQPFPTLQNLIYKGHTDMIRTMSVEPLGEYIVTGSDDHTVKIWEISTARCIRTIPTGDIVRSVAWCPNSKISLMAVATGKRVLLINPKVGDHLLVKKTDDLLAEAPRSDTVDNERIQTAVQWGEVTEEERKAGVRVVITHFREVKQVTWHGRGDYFASVMPDAANRSVLIHQLSKRRSQLPFSKSKGLVQCVLFHPVKPCLFVATQRHVRVYDLVRQELLKKLYPGCKWISSMAVHPKGDNLVVGTYEKKLMWFDLDLSTKPYQQLRLHNSAVRNVAFHQRYPLFASASDDRSVIVCHGMVYNDLLQNPLIVPLRRLEQHSRVNDFAVFDVVFHPTQPWVFSSGADSTVRLFT
ncbi:ribosome biogenesis protein BOP1 homolog isoform X2 [Anopheles ziemanni]|uniref:ribosome biogenesis protein BOP1 homolog isoform X2 n=1 Tax=Anopheles coustani TaxID=139045 RepID=UPI00265A7E33|nr:ribosome biogenesis protein BOP1 homolog isoform X2 [Anopheles coustani]XP_058178009.1 ribosome biogenesis protein BOP1 homolog isoform X2 [Anopheles ziemanni]